MAGLHGIQLIPLGIGLAGFAVAFVVQFRLRSHVSAEKVRSLLSKPSDLYPNSIPPKRVLDEKGQKLHTVMTVGGAVFAVGVVAAMLINALL